MVTAAERGVDWWVWRIVTSPDMPEGLAGVRAMSFADSLAAHITLDALADIREIYKPDQE